MVNVKCADCAEYKNEWCEKVIDSPHPDMLRDCQYFHEADRDLIKVTRCKDCKLFGDEKCLMYFDGYDWAEPDGYCHLAERREEGEAE